MICSEEKGRPGAPEGRYNRTEREQCSGKLASPCTRWIYNISSLAVQNTKDLRFSKPLRCIPCIIVVLDQVLYSLYFSLNWVSSVWNMQEILILSPPQAEGANISGRSCAWTSSSTEDRAPGEQQRCRVVRLVRWDVGLEPTVFKAFWRWGQRIEIEMLRMFISRCKENVPPLIVEFSIKVENCKTKLFQRRRISLHFFLLFFWTKQSVKENVLLSKNFSPPQLPAQKCVANFYSFS